MICRFEKEIFRSGNGFCIFAYKSADETIPSAARSKFYHDQKIHITAVGYNLPGSDTIDVDLKGTWERTKYGVQLSVESFETIAPTDAEGITAYLGSGLIKGIGPKTAKAIVARFGDKTLDVMEHDPRQLLKIKGIAQGKLKHIIDSYEKTRSLRDITSFMAPFGVSMNKISRIYDTFGDSCMAIVQHDPFELCHVKGFSFLTVDMIARKLKVSLRNPLRYSGALEFCLEEAHTQGHLYLPKNELVDRCYELLNKGFDREVVPVNDISSALSSGHQDGLLYNEYGRVYLSFDRVCEVTVAKRIVSILTATDSHSIPGIADEIQRSEQKLNQKLAPSQYRAVELCLTHPCSVMTGGPGTGKTTTLRVILDVYHRLHPDHEILLAAPTGKASRRMSEQTGFPASTLHSALGLVCEQDMRQKAPDLLSADLIVVDECSMIDMKLAYALLMRLKPGANLLLVGDPDQLPAVGAGNVLRDIIRSQIVPTAVLDKVFRQASNSRIAVNAYAVNHNDTHLQFGSDFIMLDAADGEAAAQLVMQHYFSEVDKHGIENVQILSPFRKRGAVCADSLNSQIREMVNPHRSGVNEIKCSGRTFREGDRVIQIRNSEQVSNGEVGVIVQICTDDSADVPLTIRFLDGRTISYSADMMDDVDFAYCITIHKSQGAEFPVIIVPLLKEHYIMLRRNLLYTAISRAKSKVILVGQRQAVYTAIHKTDVDKRNTVLADRLTAYYQRTLRAAQ